MALHSSVQAALSNASRAAIERRMSRIQRYWKGSRWLTLKNRYRSDSIGQLKQDAPDSTTWAPNHGHLADYVAASAITHCFDGWSYLGRALEAELSGDPDIARHLGYYAELRAAMALLAADGIGIFDRKHVVVNNSGQCECIRSGGTAHVFIWEVLQWWASDTRGYDRLQDAIQPGALPLRDWLSHYPGSARFVSTRWLEQWGLDLSRLTEDREARNLASYRPTAFTSAGPKAISDTLQSITRFWEMCEPGAVGGFPVLDRHLLREGIKLVFDAKPSRTGSRAADNYANDKRYKSDVEAMLGGVTPSEFSSEQWKRFLSYEDDAEIPKILMDAGATAGPTHPDHSKQVLARAALLLRVATGSAANLLSSITSTSNNELAFWWSGESVRRCLWQESSPPDRFADLWLDIKEATESINTWLQTASNPCRHSLRNELALETATLATTERVALWGLKL